MTTPERAAPSRGLLAAGGMLSVGLAVVASAATIYVLYLLTTRLHPIFVIPLIAACIISCVVLPALVWNHVVSVVRGRVPGA